MPKNITHKFQPRYQIDDKQITYLDENDFIKKYKGLRRICPKTFKYLCFDFFKSSRLYEKEDGIYVDVLPSSKEFKAVYGDIKLHYSIKNRKIIIENITPEKILLENYRSTFKTYKGIPYVDDLDKFKIDLFKAMEGK